MTETHEAVGIGAGDMREMCSDLPRAKTLAARLVSAMRLRDVKTVDRCIEALGKIHKVWLREWTLDAKAPQPVDAFGFTAEVYVRCPKKDCRAENDVLPGMKHRCHECGTTIPHRDYSGWAMQMAAMEYKGLGYTVAPVPLPETESVMDIELTEDEALEQLLAVLA